MPKRLNQFILLGALCGVLLGVYCQALGSGHHAVVQILYVSNIIAGLFVDMLKMVLVPLIFCTIAAGIASLGGQHAMHRIWKYTLFFFVSSMAVAMVLALLATNYFKPGAGLNLHLFADSLTTYKAKQLPLSDFVAQFLHSLFVNPFAAFARGEVLPIVIIAFITGIALVVGRESYTDLRRLLEQGRSLSIQIVGWIMYVAPLGIAALLVKLAATQNATLFTTLLKFIAVVVGTTLVHGLIVLPLALYLLTRHSPWWFLKGSRDALITAFATSSSTATVPITLRCVTEELKVSPAIAGFVVPLGATINMDGTALYEASAALFVANLVGIDLDFTQQLLVFCVSMLASIGAPGIPSAGMVTMIMVLQAVNLPVEAIAILLPIDRLLDTIRTAVNVEGDMTGSVVVQHWIGHRL